MLKLKIPPAVLFAIFAGIIWAIDQLIPNNGFDFAYNKGVALASFVVGVLIGIFGVIEFIRRSTTVNPHRPEVTSALVTSGIYQFSRNPMYLGLLIALFAIVVHFGNVWGLLALPLFVWYMNVFQIQPEEEMMQQKFGNVFKAYASKVRRWL